MKKEEKLEWLRRNHNEAYLEAENKAIAALDDEYPIFCLCGKLATGLHTTNCRKFQEAVKRRILTSLKPLLPR